MTRIFRSLRLTPLLSAAILTCIMMSAFSVATGTRSVIAHVASAATLQAAATAPPAVAPADTGTPWVTYVVLAVGVLGGALRILDVLIPGLRWLAPRTKTPLDDRALKVAEAAHDRIEALEDVVGKIVPGAGAALETRKGQAGFARTDLTTIISTLVLGMVIAVSVIGCATVKTKGEAFAAGVVTCVKADKSAVQALALKLGTEALAGALTSGIPWTTLEADADAAGEAQGIDVAACAFGGLLADLDKLLHPTASGTTVAALSSDVFAPGDPLAPGRALFSAFQTTHGITRVVQ